MDLGESMHIEEKPPLDDELLAHFGVKGMRWGVKKAAQKAAGGSGGKETIRGILKNRIYESAKSRARGKQGMGLMTKAAIGVAVVAGSVAVGHVLAKRGRARAAEQSAQNKERIDSGREAYRSNLSSVGGMSVSQLPNERRAS